MRADHLLGAEIVGLAALTAGVAWRFSMATSLIVFGAAVIVLTFLTLKAVGRR